MEKLASDAGHCSTPRHAYHPRILVTNRHDVKKPSKLLPSPQVLTLRSAQRLRTYAPLMTRYGSAAGLVVELDAGASAGSATGSRDSIGWHGGH